MWNLIRLCLAVWLCLKMGSEKMVLVGLLQRGAKDLTGSSPWLRPGLLIIPGLVNFPGYVTLCSLFFTLPRVDTFTQTDVVYPASVWLPSLGTVTQAGQSYPGWVKLPGLGKFTQPGKSNQGLVKLPRLGKVVSPDRVTLPRLGYLTNHG